MLMHLAISKFIFYFFLSEKDEDKQDKKGVDIEELLRKEENDTLTYMGWEPAKRPPGQPEPVVEVSIEKCNLCERNMKNGKKLKI